MMQLALSKAVVMFIQEKLSEDKIGTGNENYELFCSLKTNCLATRTKRINDRSTILAQ